MIDPRPAQTMKVLHDAVIELASMTPVSKVTVTEITRKAGINRATFYRHASPPGGLLASALGPELDLIHLDDQTARSAPVFDGAEITLGTIDRVIDHVVRHRGLYRLALRDTGDASVYRMLTEHLTRSSLQHIRQLPQESLPEGLSAHVSAGYFAHTLVGALETWLLRKRTTRRALTHTVSEMIPGWWQ